MEDLRVAAVQLCAPVGQVRQNLSKTAEYVRRARDRGVDIVCFPELNIPGFWCHRDLYDLAEPIPGPSSQEIVSLARETGVTILAGMAEMGKNGVVYNTQIVATPEGLAGKYSKLHVNESEIPYFSYGYDLPVFRHPKVTFGIEICYDSHFPELSTALALQGCEVLFFPHASGAEGWTGALPQESYQAKKDRWLRFMPARAYDNSLYVVICNHVGDDGGGNTYPGCSMVIDPMGRVIAEAKPYEEDMLVVDLRAADLVKVRKEGGWHFFLRYRRPELYGAVGERSH